VDDAAAVERGPAPQGGPAVADEADVDGAAGEMGFEGARQSGLWLGWVGLGWVGFVAQIGLASWIF